MRKPFWISKRPFRYANRLVTQRIWTLKKAKWKSPLIHRRLNLKDEKFENFVQKISIKSSRINTVVYANLCLKIYINRVLFVLVQYVRGSHVFGIALALLYRSNVLVQWFCQGKKRRKTIPSQEYIWMLLTFTWQKRGECKGINFCKKFQFTAYIKGSQTQKPEKTSNQKLPVGLGSWRLFATAPE